MRLQAPPFSPSFTRLTDAVADDLVVNAVHGWMQGKPLPTSMELRDAGFEKWSRGDASRARYAYIQRYGYSIPSADMVKALAALSPLVEIGAGTGLWSRLLALAGADVIATDPHPCGQVGDYGFVVGQHHCTQRMKGTAAVRAYPDRNVFCSWPTLGSSWARYAAQAMQPGRTLALIGEGEEGCTGSKCLFTVLDCDFEHVGGVPTPQWPGMGDWLSFWRKKDGAYVS